MAGAPNIKNPETVDLARKLSALTGESITEAVTKAIRERLEAVRRESNAARLEARVGNIQALVASLPDPDARSDDEIIGYDARGLPG